MIARQEGKPVGGEVAVLVERMQRIVVEYIRPASSMGLVIHEEQVVAVIRQLAERTARGEGVPEFASTPEGYFLQGLYEELSQESQGIFERVSDGKGGQIYRPISVHDWQTVLDALASKLR